MLSDAEQQLVQRFVRRERRERALFELGSAQRRAAFLNRLCHRYADVLEPRYLAPLPNMLEDPHRLMAHLRQQGAPRDVSIISMHDQYDGRVMPFTEAIDQLFIYPFPSLLICIADALCFFQAEQELGSPPRFLLERQP